MGHVLPMSSLGHALQRRGHSVHFIQVLDREPSIVDAGLSFIPIAAADQPLGTQRRLDNEMGKQKGMAALSLTLRRMLDLVHIHLRELPQILRDASPPFDLLLVDTTLIAPVTVALHCKVPVISIDILPVQMDEDSAPPFIFDWSYGNPDSDGGITRQRNWAGNQMLYSMIGPITAAVNAQRRLWDLKECANINDQWSSLLRICQVPEFVDFARKGLPAHCHHTGPFAVPTSRGKTTFPWERLNGKPLVYASLGTLVNSVVTVFETIAAAFSTLDVQLVLTTGGGLTHDVLGSLPGDVILVDQAPQLELLPRAALVVTHCGINTSLETLSAGKPMVCIPVTFDQPGNARRLHRLGVCEIVGLQELTVDKLRAAAQKVLGDEQYRQRAEQVAEQIKELNGLDKAIQLIEQTMVKLRTEV